jgi:hypothetical protein
MVNHKPNIKAWLAASAVIIAATLGLVVPTAQAQAGVPATAAMHRVSGHTATAATCYYITEGLYLTYVYYPSIPEYQVTLSSSSGTCWTEVNGESWNDPISGKTVEVYELESDGLCLDEPTGDLSDGILGLDSCVAGDQGQLIYLDDLGSGLYWLASVGETSSCVSQDTGDYGLLESELNTAFGTYDPVFACLPADANVNDYWWLETTQSG